MKKLWINPLMLSSALFTAFSGIAQANPKLLDISNDPLSAIASFSQAKENRALRETCNNTKTAVDTHYENLGSSTLNSFEQFSDQLKEDIRRFEKEDMLALSESYLREKGVIFSTNGAIVALLHNTYQPIVLYDQLKEDKEFTKQLFNALFKKELTEAAFEIGLKALLAASPVQIVYAKKGSNATEVYEAFKEEHKESFLNYLSKKALSTNYFLWGIDADKSLLSEGKTPYTIIISQSQIINQSHNFGLDRKLYLPENSAHIILYNADQKFLEISDLPRNTKNLVLTNVQKNATVIGDVSLSRFYFLETIVLQGLENIPPTIGEALFGVA